MPAVTSYEVRLASRPQGWPTPDNFSLVRVDVPPPGDGEVLVRNRFMSVDPYMRGRMNDAKSYAPPVQIGEVMGGGATGKVIASNNRRFELGDFVEGMFGWQEYAVSNGKGVRKLDAKLAPISTALGVLGIPGPDRENQRLPGGWDRGE